MIDVELVLNNNTNKVLFSLIGYGVHARRLELLFKNIENIELFKIYHPNNKNSQNITYTNIISELYLSDAILILSPPETHFEYLKILSTSYNGYIFCEKPPVLNTHHLNLLNKFKNKRKIFFNFNLRFSKLTELINKYFGKDCLFGEPTNIYVSVTHGLAFKKNYTSSWRAINDTDNILIKNVGIHYIDLFSYIFGDIKKIYIINNLKSGNGKNPDCSTLLVNINNKFSLSLYLSYSNPYSEKIIVYGTNGILEINENNYKLSYPREIFDGEGFFASPPEYFYVYDSEYEYAESLYNSLFYFFDIVKEKKYFPKELFNLSIKSNKIMLKI